jgi:glutaredoxin-like protein
MMLLSDAIKNQVRNEIADLPAAVRLVMFTQEFECQYCKDTRALVQEVADLSDSLTAEVYDFVTDKQMADDLGIDKIPAIAVVGQADYGVRLYGIPGGYEFTSLLHAIKNVGAGITNLSEQTLQFLETVDEPVHVQVFVTPTCPYCPSAVVLAHQMAIASPMVRADMVEATEFPHLSIKYNVMGVPRTIINETVFVEGAVPESVVVEKLGEALSESA